MMELASKSKEIVEEECQKLNEIFIKHITQNKPFVSIKTAMTLDGKIATRTGESKWITGPASRAFAMRTRLGSDAILVGVNTVLADDSSLNIRPVEGQRSNTSGLKQPRRIVLDSEARTPLTAKVVTDEHAQQTVIVITRAAPAARAAALRSKVTVWVAPRLSGGVDLRWVLKRLGSENVTSLLVEGGGEVNSSFLFGKFAHRIAFFYAPKIFGGRDARKGVAGEGVTKLDAALKLHDVDWKMLGDDLLLLARIA